MDDQGKSREREDRLLAVMQQLPDGVVIMDRARVVRYVNPAAEKFLGIKKEDIAGEPFKHSVGQGKLNEIEMNRWPGLTTTVEAVGLETEWEGERAHLVLLRDISDRKRVERELREERDFSTGLIQNTPTFFTAVGPEGRILMMNDAMLRTLGHDLDEILGKDFFETVPMESDRENLSSVFDGVLKYEKQGMTVSRIKAKDGRTLFVEWHIGPVFNRDGDIYYFSSMGIDITDRRQTEMELQESEARYQSLLSAAFEGIAVVENNEIVDANSAMEDMFGYQHSELIVTSVLDLIADESRGEVQQGLAERGKEPFETVCVRKDGSKFNAEIRGKPHLYKGRPVQVMVVRDITELVSLREKLLNLSHLDELTGLSNRRGFQFLAYQQMKLANRSKKGLVLIFLDLDNMKWINDNLGHKAGDLALIETAEILRKTLRKSDILARMGGDEFVVLAIEAVSNSEKIIINRMEEILKVHNDQSTRGYDLSFSYGTAYYDPQAPSSLEALLAEADEEMYEAKRCKKSK